MRPRYCRSADSRMRMQNALLLSNVPRSGYIAPRDQSMLGSGVIEGGKNTASFHFRE